MKQVILSMVVIAAAAGILAATVLGTVSFLRQCEERILTGDLTPAYGYIRMQTR